ncbi:MAG: AAA family ATPase [Verrucomicrobiaceae bacterium]|nr:AAA family ATPase [Verrucomicrobiaceae bacterium]
MRLLAVRLQNLNSLSGEHVVRFDEAPLSAAGVFLITGPTGAGKSTLLDAMTLALYGRAARYGNEKADEMMSRHTMECLAEVDFETGGRRLRATWRLGKTKSGNLKPVQRTLADADTLQILADKGREVDAMIESLTGLDAQRFLRSVLLAQGQFAAFLKAKPNERAELLEKITGTEIYRDLSILAHETHREKDEHARQLKAALGAVTVLDDEARVKIDDDLTEARTAASRLQIEQAAASQHFQAQLEQSRIVADLTKLAAIANQLQGAQTEATAKAAEARKASELAKQQRAQREPIWEKAAGMAAQSEQLEMQLRDSRATYQTWAKDQKEASLRRETAERELTAHLDAAQILEAWLKEHAADADLGNQLPKLRFAIREWRVAHEKLADGRKRHAEAQTLRARLQASETQVVSGTKKAVEYLGKIKLDREALEQLTKKLDSQREITRHAELVAGLDEHRHDLRPGEPCPLCGATEHPFVSSEVNTESQLQNARKLLITLEKQHDQAQRTLTALERDLVKIEAELNAEKTRADELRKRLAEVQPPADEMLQQWSEDEVKKRVLSSTTPDDAERELSALENRATAFIKKQQEAAQQRTDRQKLEGDIQLARADEVAKTQRLDELKAEGVSLRGRVDALNQQLSELLGGKTLAADRQEHETRVLTSERVQREAEMQLAKLQTDLAATQAKLEQLEARRKPFAEVPVLSGEDINELEAKAKILHEAFTAKHKEVGSLEQQIKSDDDARKRREAGGAELHAAEADALRWGRLRELIGSADGAKFSRFAQSLTLRQLIGLANEHLKVLAERYRLIAASGDELDLRIVDLYQANADRPMESLSGGESFLASLALALGLSELASRHHQIDSLFIDEGFGTLDSDTLEIALSALENLRSRGKTIGLISHVDLLKERLTTQVRIVRGSCGTSSIEVVS